MKILGRTETNGAIVEIDSHEYDALVMAMAAINGEHEGPTEEQLYKRKANMFRSFRILEIIARGQMSVNLLKTQIESIEYELLKAEIRNS